MPITRAGAESSTVGSSAAELESAPSPIRIPGRIEVPTNAPSELTSVIFEEGVVTVESRAFYNCVGLLSVKFPDSLTTIESEAFRGCSSLQSIHIPKGVTSIGENVFAQCTSIQTITVAKTNTVYIGEGNCLIERKTQTLLRGCDTSVIPSYVLIIGEYAFYGCQAFTDLVLSNGITRIEDHAFVGCTNLTTLTLPKYLVYLGEAFSDCSSLTSVTMFSSVKTIEARAFSNCKNLKTINYSGTKKQWDAIKKGHAWSYGIKGCTVVCADASFSL